LEGVTCNILEIKSDNSLDYELEMGFYLPCLTFCERPLILEASNGGFPVHNSYKTTPKLQISTLLSYGFSLQISGGHY